MHLFPAHRIIVFSEKQHTHTHVSCNLFEKSSHLVDEKSNNKQMRYGRINSRVTLIVALMMRFDYVV